MLTSNAAHCTIISENDLVMFIRESKLINCNFPNTIANTNIGSVATIVFNTNRTSSKKAFYICIIK